MEQNYKDITGRTKSELIELIDFCKRLAFGTNAGIVSFYPDGVKPKEQTVYDFSKKILYFKVGRKRVWMFDGEKLKVYS